MKYITHFRVYLLSFFIPFTILLSSYFLFGVYPVGHYSVLISDLNTQYIQFYTYLNHVLTEGKSLQYSFELGGGTNFFGTFAYYLASPFSLLTFLFPKHLPDTIFLITLLKVGCAGLTASIYFHVLMGKKRLEIVLFSTAFALMGFIMDYSFHIMWLDGMIWLPIIFLSIDRILHERKLGLFIIALAATFMSNFYLSYMIGILTFLYFLIRLFSIYRIIEIAKWLKYVGMFVVGTAVSGALAAWVILPAYKALGNNPYNVQTLHFKLEWKLNILDFYWKLLSGGFDSSIFGAPNVYASLLVLLLFPLYVWMKEIPNREKLLVTVATLFVFISFGFPFFNLIWHGLKWPNAYPYRYVFAFSFLIIFMAARAFMYMSKQYIRPLWTVYGIHIVLIGLLWVKRPVLNKKILLINIALLTALAILLTIRCMSVSFMKATLVLLVFVMVADVGFNTYATIRFLNKEMGYTSRNEYAMKTEVEQAFQYVNKDNIQQYQVASMFYRTLNNSLQYDYPSFQNFNSMANGSFHCFLHNVGYSTSPDFIVANNSGDTLLFDAILRVGYTINDGSIHKYGYDTLQTFDNVTVSKNKLLVPFGYAVKELNDDINKEPDPFAMQEMLIGKNKGDLFQNLTPMFVSYDNLKPASEPGKYERISNNEPASITVQVTAPTDMQIYGYIGGLNTFTQAEVNHNYHVYIPSKNERSITDFGYMTANTPVTVTLKVNQDTLSLNDFVFQGLDVHTFENTVKDLQRNSMNIENRKGTTIQGTIHVDDNSLYVFSIPYDTGWTVLVDGKKTLVEPVAKGLIGTKLQKGEHSIVLTYQSPGLREGIMISIFGVAIFAGLLVWQYRSYRKNNRKLL